MWRAQKFCCCISFQIGCAIISFVTFCLCIVHLVEFFRVEEIGVAYDASDWLNVLWGMLHLVAAMCLSYSLLVRALISILIYIIIEAVYLIYVIIYTSVSCALGTNTYANYSLTYSIVLWIFVVLICVTTIYFLYIVTSYYILRRQQRNDANQQV
ncbi:uncharacterized protein LOC119552944 isoform X3 [Drosophila subpulchrella]|uniref:uncharacterized protein LOC119552944 isoform X3 n=1 Tax=Drosophila subpulchrella TaxID=1486046 RepID=UPI0018A15B5D|nr:uncharacterized protein LOC119552944 isoform X3 [Drosophila subpulchrella]